MMPKRTDISSIPVIGVDAQSAPSPRGGEGWGEGGLR